MINLELYRIFYVVAKTKNITKASKILNISQPAVSKHIKNLEEQLNTPLFIRTKKGVVLNDCGKKVFLKVKNAINILEEAEKEINEYENYNKGNIRIGISTSLMKKFLLQYIEIFHQQYPNITIDIETYPTAELIKELKSGLIDIIICKFPQERDLELEYKKLGQTKYVFISSNKYKELKNKKISINDLAKYPILFQKPDTNSRNSLDEYLKDNNIQVEPKMVIGSSSLLADFVSIGYGIGYSTELYIKELIDQKKIFKVNINPKTPKIDYGIITLKNNVIDISTSKLIEIIKLNML